MGLVQCGMSVVLAGALVVVGGQRVCRAGVSVVDAVQRLQAGDVGPVMGLFEPHPQGPHRQMQPGQRRPSAEMPLAVGDVAGFAGLLMGAGPAMLVEEYGLAWHRTRGAGRVAI